MHGLACRQLLKLNKLAARLLLLVAGSSVFYTPAAAQPAQSHAEQGVAFAQAGDFKSAELELRKPAELAPGNAQILATLGGVLGMEQKLDEASVYLEKALQLEPTDNLIRRNVGANQWQRGHFREARRHLERVLAADPNDRQAMLLLGMVAENSGDYGTAAKMLQSVPELLERQPAAVAALASAFYHTGRAMEARTALRSLRATADPTSAFMGGRVAADAKDYELAEQMFESIRSSYPDSAALAFNMALAEYHQGRFPECQSTLENGALQGKLTGDSYNLLGRCLEKEGRINEAISALKKAIEADSARESNYLDLCSILSTANMLPFALEVATGAAQLFPRFYDVIATKGSIESRLQHFTDAVATYRRAVTLKPDAPEPQRLLAVALWSAGMEDESARIFEQLIQRFPNHAASYESYGAALVDDPPNAAAAARGERLLKRALSLDGSLVQARFLLGNLALRRGSAQKALDYFDAALKLDPQSSKLHFARSRALKHLGRAEAAAAEFAVFEQFRGQADSANAARPALGLTR
jgi:superkiller protein 3